MWQLLLISETIFAAVTRLFSHIYSHSCAPICCWSFWVYLWSITTAPFLNLLTAAADGRLRLLLIYFYFFGFLCQSVLQMFLQKFSKTLFSYQVQTQFGTTDCVINLHIYSTVKKKGGMFFSDLCWDVEQLPFRSLNTLYFCQWDYTPNFLPVSAGLNLTRLSVKSYRKSRIATSMLAVINVIHFKK